MARVSEAFSLRLDEAATPERVESAAKFLGHVLKAADPTLPDDSVTLVVTNYKMGAHVRPRSPEAQAATDKVLSLLNNPVRALERDPTMREIAEVFARVERSLYSATIVRPRKSEPIATINDQFVDRMKNLVNIARQDPVLRGTTIVYTPICRIGRTDENAQTMVRIRLDGDFKEIALASSTDDADFYRAAAVKRTFPVHLNAAWRRGTDGRLCYDSKLTRVTRVDLNWNPITGKEFVATVNDRAPSGYCDDDDFAERIASIQQGRE